MNSYSPTGNVDDYYSQQGSQGLTPEQISPRTDVIPQEDEENKTEQPDNTQPNTEQPAQQTEEKKEEPEQKTTHSKRLVLLLLVLVLTL